MAIFSIKHKGNGRLRLFQEKKKEITMSSQKMKKRVKCSNFSKWKLFSKQRKMADVLKKT